MGRAESKHGRPWGKRLVAAAMGLILVAAAATALGESAPAGQPPAAPAPTAPAPSAPAPAPTAPAQGPTR
jgi:hypothetical protein